MIDINADVGEGLHNEAQLMPYLNSCNIACGGHAGDAETMKTVIRLAEEYQVKIGAHPSFPDRENFGRNILNISSEALKKSLMAQLESFQEVISSERATLHHVKPHGALYNLAAKDAATAEVILEAMKSLHIEAKLYAPYGSMLAKLAYRKGIPVVYEAFADRNYQEDLSLVPRSRPHALITEPKAVFEQVQRMVLEGKVHTETGKEVPIKAATFCVHGDQENALEILKYLNKAFAENDSKIDF